MLVLIAAEETSWVMELIKASPGLGVALILVVLFLREQRAQRQEAAAQQAACHEQQKTNTATLTSAVNDASNVIRQNSVAYGKVCEALDGQRQAIKDAVRDGFESFSKS